MKHYEIVETGLHECASDCQIVGFPRVVADTPPTPMTLNEYQDRSMRTAVDVPDYPHPDWLFQTSGFGLGIAGEAGEVADYLKKVIHHGHPLDREVVKKELGDVLWYVQAIARRCGLTLEEVGIANIQKLEARYPNGWTKEDSINRTDE